MLNFLKIKRASSESINGKIVIAVLTAFCLAVECFFHIRFILLYAEYYGDTFTDIFVNLRFNFLIRLLSILPPIIILIFTLTYKKGESVVLLKIAPVCMLLHLLGSILFTASGLFRSGLNQFIYDIYYNTEYYIVPLVLCVGYFASYICILISAFKGFKKKQLLEIAMLVCVLCELVCYLYYYIRFNSEFSDEAIVFLVLEFFAFLAFDIALFYLGVNNTFEKPMRVSVERSRNIKITADDPKQELKELIFQLQQGKLTPEEFQSKRAEILNKL